MSAQHCRHLLFLLPVCGLVALGVAMPLPAGPWMGTAVAQEIRERRSIIDMLFRGNRPRVTNDSAEIPRYKRKKRRPKIAVDNTADTNDAVQVAKAPDAKKVLVIGDFMASALADGLGMATDADTDLVIDPKPDGSSGLVRTDHLDWPQALRQAISERHPALVIIMLGSNDRQQMTVSGVKQKFRSDAWNVEYERRIGNLIKAATDSRVPFIWTGLPSFQSPSLSADAATLNNLYRAKVEAAGGVFIDIWDGFADEEGKFIASGSDFNGQPVRLRGADGLSLTKAGKRKMAFYLEKDLRRLTGTDEIANLIRLDASNLPLGEDIKPPAATAILTVPPVSLADPELDGASQLLDGKLLPKTSGQSPRDLLIEKGETAIPPDGRIDDFRWQPTAKPAG
jgi:hypothetical protein